MIGGLIMLLYHLSAHLVLLYSEQNYELTELVLRWVLLCAVLVFICIAIIILANYEYKKNKNESNN
jgi:L-asparagine transporter-like permease